MKKFLIFILILFFLYNNSLISQTGIIEGMETYEDPIVRFSLKYPQKWIKTAIPGNRLILYSSEKVRYRFREYETEGPIGAKIDIYSKKMESDQTLIDFMVSTKIFDRKIYSDPFRMKLDDVVAYKQVYSFEL